MFAKTVGRRITALATTLAVVIGLAITPAFTATAVEGDEPIVAEQVAVVEEAPAITPPAEPVVEPPVEPAAPDVPPADVVSADLPVAALPIAALPIAADEPAEQPLVEPESKPVEASTPSAPQALMTRSSAPTEPASVIGVQSTGISPTVIGPFVVDEEIDVRFTNDGQNRDWGLGFLTSLENPNLDMNSNGVLTGYFDTPGAKTLTVSTLHHVVGKLWLPEFQQISVQVKPAITTATLPDTTVGDDYVEQIWSTNPYSGVTFNYDAALLPPGLSFTERGYFPRHLELSGEVGDIPQNAATYNFWVTATVNGVTSDPKWFSITVGYPQPVVTTTTLPAATVGVGYSATLSATPGATITWSASGLPDGLSLDSATGVISGEPAYKAEYGDSIVVPVTVTANNGSDSTPVALSLTVLTPSPVLDKVTLPDATVDVFYSHQLTVTNGLGNLKFKLTTQSVLPDGLELSESGLISGTPTYDATAGDSLAFNFRVRVDGTAGHSSQNFSITLNTPAPVLDRVTLPDATVDVFYSHQLTVTNGFGNLKFKLTTQSVLPDGLELSESGLISGTPSYDSAAGESMLVNFRVRVDGTAGHSAKNFSITLKTPAPTIETDALADGWWKQPYNQPIATTGPGVIVTVYGLPAGLSLTGTSITGQTRFIGTKLLRITATNTAGSDTEYVLLTINDKPALRSAPTAKVQTGDTVTAKVRYYGEDVRLGLGADAPAGMTINKNGRITWTPTTAGTYVFTVTATNPAGTDTQLYVVKVLDAPVLIQGSLHDGVINMPYRQKLHHDGSNVKFEVIAGALPQGVTLTKNGVLTGAATEAGDFDFRVRAKNAIGTDRGWFTLTVLQPGATLSVTSVIRGDTLTVSGSGYLPGDDLELWLHSTPVLLGTVTATNGSFTRTVVIPANTEAGAHHLVITGTQSGTQSVPLMVAAPAPAPVAAPAPAAAPQSSTPSTTQSRSPQLTVTPADTTTEVTEVATDDDATADDAEEADEELPTLNKPVAEGETTAAVPANWSGLIMAAFVLLLAGLLVWFLLWRRRRAAES